MRIQHPVVDDMARDNRIAVGTSEPSFLAALIGDGRPLLIATGAALILSGVFALFLSVRGEFLPHDTATLGLTANDLCHHADCTVRGFMFHDRVAFGGSIAAVGILYLWLAIFPLARGESWAWWAFLVSGVAGFASFLTYLGYGYFDDWHGASTFVLLPSFVVGLVRSWRLLSPPRGIRALLAPGAAVKHTSRYGLGRLMLLLTAAGMVAAGLTISVVGMTSVFVPQDLTFMGIEDRHALDAISPRLVSVIAHDRAGFGGGIASAGILAACCAWCGRPSPALWQALALAGACGFGAAILVHPAVGYNDFVHISPAILGACFFIAGIAFTYHRMHIRAGATTRRQ